MLTEPTNTLLQFIMTLLVNTSEDISDVIVTISEKVVFKSDWKGAEIISELGDKWKKSNIPPSIEIQGMKFSKLHASPYNLIYRAIKEGKSLIGAQQTVQSETIQILSLMAQSPNMPLISTALKDLMKSIVKLGEGMSKCVELDPNHIQMNLSYLENQRIIEIFMNSMKHMQFLCEYVDRGDKVAFFFKYKKVETKTYSDDVYKRLMKR